MTKCGEFSQFQYFCISDEVKDAFDRVADFAPCSLSDEDVIAFLQQWLDTGNSIDAIDPVSERSLLQVATFNHCAPSVIDWLLQRGATVNGNPAMESPLYNALAG